MKLFVLFGIFSLVIARPNLKDDTPVAEPVFCNQDSQCVDYGQCVNHRCVCDRVCPEIYDPVCGSDGHTYSSECDMEVASCDEHKLITVAHDGSCNDAVAEPTGCTADSDCADYAQCVNHQCVCDRVCPEVYNPVCGSDGHTYSSFCDLQVASCREHKFITTAHMGSCVTCTSDSQCVDYGHCENNRCVCDSVCPDDYSPVCGSDGHTYSNICEMREKSCHEHKLIISAHAGTCTPNL